MSSLAKAIATGDLTQLPSRRDEDWRWTDLRGLLRTLPPTPGHADVTTEGPFAALGGERFLVPNGFVEGFTHIEGGPDSPVAQLRFVAAEAGSIATAVLVAVRAGQTLTLLESYEAPADGAVSDVVLDIQVAEGGRLERVVLAADGPTSVTVSTATVTLAPGASYAQTVLTSGARRQRIETRVSHPGQGASVRLDGAYLLHDQRHADTTSVVTHSGLGGVTSQLTKGVVDGQARGVFQGRIVVERGADQTDARMGHHALILSDKAEVDAKPELLIFADDVQCAHGNTVGALDENALFYAQQRGMPFETARAMLTEAFVGEVVDRIEHEGAREIAGAWVAQQLGTGQ
jgi:Fe-S cluster assembly protein SufD